VGGTDWVEWHRAYDDPRSPLTARLAVVQGLVAEVLDARRGRTTRIVSLCAGSGRDVLDVLAADRERAEVRARLVEIDPVLAGRARDAVARHALSGVEVVVADAAVTDVYAGSVPADLVLLCGVLGNVSDGDARTTVEAMPSFCATGGIVVWTRHRRAPDLTGAIRRWFAGAGFAERAFVSPGAESFAVGVHRLEGPTAPLASGRRLFAFIR
jgi:hypothetical protein